MGDQILEGIIAKVQTAMFFSWYRQMKLLIEDFKHSLLWPFIM